MQTPLAPWQRHQRDAASCSHGCDEARLQMNDFMLPSPASSAGGVNEVMKT